MATNFPNSLDSLTNPATTDQLNSPSHAAQHANANDAIEQLQAKVGVNSSAVTTSHDYKIAQLEAAITAGVSGTKLIYQDVRNQSGVSLTKGTPVRVTGSDGASGKLLIGAASNSSEGGSSKTFGLLSSTLSNNSNGQVVTNGLLEGVDTTGAVDGDPVWLGVDGAKIFGLVNKPVAPAHLVYLGVVVRGGQQNTGSIFVSIQNGFEVDELHNVLINNTTLQNKNALVYDSATQLWKNYDLSNDFVLSGDLQNSLGDYIPLSVLGEPDGVAKLDLDGNLIVPENKIIIEGATADAHELTLQAPDVTSDITVTLPNASGTLALTTQLFSGSYTDLTNKPNIVLGAPQWTANHTLLANGENTRYLIGDIVYDGGNIYVANFENESIPTSNTTYWTSLGSGKRLNIDGRDIPNITYDQLNGKPTIPSLTGYATENYVSTAISNLVDTAPTTLDTLNELAAALGDDANFATTVTNSLATKAPIASPTFTGTVTIPAGSAITGVPYLATANTFTAQNIINASGTSTVDLIVRATASQTSDLQQWQDSTGTVISSVNSSGHFATTRAYLSEANVGPDYTTGTQGYLKLGTYSTTKPQLTIRAIASQTANFVEWQNSSGTTLGFINAEGSIQSANRIISPGDFEARGNSFHGNAPFSGATVNITTRATTQVGAIIRGVASQTANLQEWQNSAGTVLAKVTSTGDATLGYAYVSGLRDVNGTGSYLNMQASTSGILVNTRAAANVGLIVKGAASQTANLQEWQNSAGSIVSSIGPTGVASLSAGNYQYQYPTVTIGDAAYGFSAEGGYLRYYTAYASGLGGHIWYGGPNNTYERMVLRNNGSFSLKGVASQTADLQQWQNSAGTVLAKVDASGIGTFAQGVFAGGAASIDGGGGATLSAIYTGALKNSATAYNFFSNVTGSPYATVVVKGLSSQTTDLQQWQDSAGTVLTRIDSSGQNIWTYSIRPQVTPSSGAFIQLDSNQVRVTQSTAGAVAFIVKGAASQSANLQEWQNSAGTVLSKVDSTGAMFTITPAVGTDTTQVATTAFVIDQIDASTQPGALYQTTAPTSPEIGQIWIDSDENVTTFDSNIIRRKTVTATAGQTIFTTDVPFIDGFEQVFMNGLLLVKTTDYATSNSNTVTLTSGAAVSDIIEIVTVTGANSVSTYTQAETDALLAANTSVAPLSISTNTTLVAKKRYFVTSASALTLTLPASPALNDEIQILDASGNASTYNITVARNGNKINGGTGNLIIDMNGAWTTLLYTGSTYGWKVG